MSKQITNIIITAIIFFGLGYVVSMSGIIIPKTGDRQENTFQAGWDAAEKRLAETGFAPMMGIEEVEIKSVNGMVQKIEGDKISLKIQPLSPLADPNLDIRTIDISSAKIYQLAQKDQEQYRKETEEFNKKMQEQINNPEETTERILPPEFFDKEEVDFSKIQINQQIIVIAEKDIKEVKEFKASEVVIQSTPILPEVID